MSSVRFFDEYWFKTLPLVGETKFKHCSLLKCATVAKIISSMRAKSSLDSFTPLGELTKKSDLFFVS
jgi:hypothetical protein